VFTSVQSHGAQLPGFRLAGAYAAGVVGGAAGSGAGNPCRGGLRLAVDARHLGVYGSLSAPAQRQLV